MNVEFLLGLGISEEEAAVIVRENEKEISDLKLTNAIQSEFVRRRAKNINAAMKLFNREGLSADEEDFGGLSGKMDAFVKENDYLFSQEAKKPLFSSTTPGKNRETVTKEEFNKMGYQKRLKLFHESPELYKRLTKE